jgi:hypothetical protein
MAAYHEDRGGFPPLKRQDWLHFISNNSDRNSACDTVAIKSIHLLHEQLYIVPPTKLAMAFEVPVRNPSVVPVTTIPPVTAVVSSPTRVNMTIEAWDTMPVVTPVPVIIA